MRLLIDSHALLWSVDSPGQLSGAASTALQDPANQLLIGVGTIWEISIKVGLGKLTLSLPYRKWMEGVIVDMALSVLPITVEYADRQASLPHHHGDPFDRLLIVQSLAESIPIISSDAGLDPYGIVRVW